MNRFKKHPWFDAQTSAMNYVIVFSMFFILLSVWPAWGATYYVKAWGNDSLDGLSDATAWATIAKVQATVKSGDNVYFRSQDTWTSSGAQVLAATAGVTYNGSGYGTGTRAKITTSFSGTPGYASYAVVAINASNVTFRGFEVDVNHARLGGIYIGERSTGDISSVTIDNCLVHDNGGISGDWNYGIHVTNKTAGKTTSNVSIANCEVYNTFHEGIAVYAAWGYYDSKNDNVSIRNCYVHNAGTGIIGAGVGVLIANNSKNVTVEYCNLVSNSGYGILIRVSPSYEGGGNVLAGPENTIVRYNYICNSGLRGVYIYSPAGLMLTGSFYSNIFYNNGQAGLDLSEFTIQVPSGDAYGAGTTFSIYNNTFYSVLKAGTNSNNLVALGIWNNLDNVTVNFKNNILYGGNFTALYIDGSPTVNHSNNLFFTTSDPVSLIRTESTNYRLSAVKTWEASARNADPLFVSAGTNFRLQSASPAIDAGVPVGLTRDIMSNPVPSGTAPDIGAFEYVASQTSTATTPVTTTTASATTPTITVAGTTTTTTTVPTIASTRVAKVKKKIFTR